jgi:hypothetical protein
MLYREDAKNAKLREEIKLILPSRNFAIFARAGEASRPSRLIFWGRSR